MAVEMAIWKMTQQGPSPLQLSGTTLESDLEDMLSKDLSLLGERLLLVGRQVKTKQNKFIDLLGLDLEGRLHVIEVKRDRTPRDVVGQVLDYASWVRTLGPTEVEELLQVHHGDDFSLEAAYQEVFGTSAPEVVNEQQQLTIVAASLDEGTERIVEYLADAHEVPINAVFFRSFRDGADRYLARSWLIEPNSGDSTTRKASTSKIRKWNGRDFYVVQGRTDDHRWEFARKYGLLNSGGGSWYWKPLRNLQVGARVFAYVGGAGYVGVGEVTGEMHWARDAVVEQSGTEVPLLSLPDIPADIRERAVSTDEEVSEMVVPVRWLETRPIEAAFKRRGLFASQVTVCKLRDEKTIEAVESEFGLADDDG